MATRVKSKTIRRCGSSGKETTTVKTEEFEHKYKDKRTNHQNSVSFSQKEIDEMMNGDYTALRITVVPTDEVIVIEKFHRIIHNAKRIPRKDRETGRFLGWSFFLVSNFR